ncbi:MAG TPA: polysaccharide biosynthesis protein, partial [Sorangium sp.]|nr:polysaccharide biosynthesis protein [Sorangium sp.]
GPINVLLTSGGFGIGPLAAAIQSFAGLPQLKVTVVCGASQRRRARVEAAAAKAGIAARVIGYEHDMPARLAEAHVVVGKPGGLTSSETLACGRPMAIMGTCPGQEEHNEQWLCVNHAGVRIDPRDAGPRIEQLRKSGRLARMARAAQRLGRPRAAINVVAAGLRLTPAQQQAA